jgi:hypothetical protein
MNEKENIFDIRSNIDPVDNKPYVEVLKEDKDYKARFAAKNKKDFNVQLKKDNVEADLSKGPEGKNIRLKKDNLEAAFKNKKDFNVQLKKDNFEAGLSKGPGEKNIRLKKDNLEAALSKVPGGKKATVGYNKGNFKIQASKGPEGNSAMFSYTKTLGSKAKENLSQFVDSKADGGFIIGKGKDYIKDLL